MINKVYAAITNPALKGATNPESGPVQFAERFAVLWRTLIIVGGLAFILYFLMGGFGWITAGGDSQKIEESQKKITQGLIGLAILAGSYVITLFIEQAIGIDLLNIEWPTVGN